MRKAIFLLFLSGAAADPCASIPADAHDYLKANPAWHIVTTNDLAQDDRIFWQKHSRDHCPGLTVVDFDGTGQPFTVLGLLRGSASNAEQMTIALRGKDVHTLRAAHKAGNPTVLYREKPGTAKEWDSEKRVVIAHQSVSIVQMESSSEQFYFAGGRFQSIWTSD